MYRQREKDPERERARFDFSMLGVRVPTVVISPWVAKGEVVDTIFDHTSMIKTLRELFSLDRPPLSPRERNANSLLGIFTEEQARKVEDMPELERHDIPGDEKDPRPSAGETDTPFEHIDSFAQSLFLLSYAVDAAIDQGRDFNRIDFDRIDLDDGIARYNRHANDQARIDEIYAISERFMVQRSTGGMTPPTVMEDIQTFIERLIEGLKQVAGAVKDRLFPKPDTDTDPDDGPGQTG